VLISGIADLRGVTASIRHGSAIFQRRVQPAILRISLRIHQHGSGPGFPRRSAGVVPAHLR